MEKDAFTRHGWKACLDCGDSIAPNSTHECEDERYQNFQVCLWMVELTRIEEALANFAQTPEGAFECFYAEHSRPPLSASEALA